MKLNYLYIVLILLFTFANIITAQDSARVSFSANSDNPVFSISDFNIFSGKKVDINLSAGVYNIKIKRELYAWDGQEIQDTLKIKSDSAGIFIVESNQGKVKQIKNGWTINYNFIDSKILNSSPEDAKVFVGDSLLGHTPLRLAAIPVKLEFRKSGYTTKTTELEKISEPVNLDFWGTYKMKKFTESVWFPVLLGTAALLGGISAHFKTTADKKYDKYVNEGGEELLREVNKDDLISGVSLGLLEVNLVYIIYKLLDE